MSGVTDFVEKAFKSVKKVATKLWDNKIVRAAIIVAAVYFTYGMATQTGWFAPVAGTGGTAASSVAAGTTFTTVAESGAVVGGIGTGGAGVGAAGGAVVGTPISASVGAGGLGAAEAGVAFSGGGGNAAAGGFQSGQLSLAGSPELAVGSTDALSLGSTTSVGSAAEGGVMTTGQIAGNLSANLEAAGGVGTQSFAATEAATAAAEPSLWGSVKEGASSAGSWMKENPIATLMAGQAVSGAVSSYEARKAEERALQAEQDRFNRRGLYGFDTSGQPAVVNNQNPGLVDGQMNNAPFVRTPQGIRLAAPSAPMVSPIPRNQLAQLQSNGIILNNQRYTG